MDERMRAGMAEATRLTQAGQLAEATALIQRVLRGLPVGDGTEARRGRIENVIEAEGWVVPDAPPAEVKEADSKDAPAEETYGKQEYSSPATGGHKGPNPATPPRPPLREEGASSHKGSSPASPSRPPLREEGAGGHKGPNPASPPHPPLREEGAGGYKGPGAASSSRPPLREERAGGHKGPSPASPPHPPLREEGAGGHKGPGAVSLPFLPLREMPTVPFSPHMSHRADSETVYEGGQFVDGSYSNATGTRGYKLYIPSGYRGQAVPLVVMLHGCTQTPLDFATGTQMNGLAEEQTFLVAYPHQAQGANSSRCWNWFQVADQQRDAGEPSLIAGMTRQIMREYRVDAKRVYVAGMSAGGAMAVVMAATYPDLYAAVGVHSGLAYGAAHDLPSGFVAMTQGASQEARQLARVIPLIVFHGDSDTTVAPVNADHLVEQWLQASSNGARREARVKRGKGASGRAYSRFTYADADGRTIVEKWLVHQAGHAWSGGSAGGSFTDPKGPGASAEMMRFFGEHAKERSRTQSPEGEGLV